MKTCKVLNVSKVDEILSIIPENEKIEMLGRANVNAVVYVDRSHIDFGTGRSQHEPVLVVEGHVRSADGSIIGYDIGTIEFEDKSIPISFQYTLSRDEVSVLAKNGLFEGANIGELYELEMNVNLPLRAYTIVPKEVDDVPIVYAGIITTTDVHCDKESLSYSLVDYLRDHEDTLDDVSLDFEDEITTDVELTAEVDEQVVIGTDTAYEPTHITPSEIDALRDEFAAIDAQHASAPSISKADVLFEDIKKEHGYTADKVVVVEESTQEVDVVDDTTVDTKEPTVVYGVDTLETDVDDIVPTDDEYSASM